MCGVYFLFKDVLLDIYLVLFLKEVSRIILLATLRLRETSSSEKMCYV